MRHPRLKTICGLVIVALTVSAATVRAAEEPGANAQSRATTIRSSIQRVTAALADQPEAYAAVPLSLPKPSRVHKSKSMLIVTAVSTVASVAGTMYALKMMKEAQDKQTTGQ